VLNTLQLFSKYIIISFCLSYFLIACDSGGGSPTATSNVTVSADLPSNIVSLVKAGESLNAQIEYGNNSDKMIITIDGMAEKTIQNYNLSSITFNLLITIDLAGELVPLATARKTVQFQGQPSNKIDVTIFEYPDMDGDGASNLLEIVNNTNYNDANEKPGTSSGKITGSTSTNYRIGDVQFTGLSNTSSSTAYKIDNTSHLIFSSQHNKSQSVKENNGIPVYEIRINN